MYHEEINSCLGFSLECIESFEDRDGVRWYKACDILGRIGLSNTTNSATKKMTNAHRKKFEMTTISTTGRTVSVRPVFVTEHGIWLMIMHGNSKRLKAIRERLSLDVLPRVTTIQ